MPDKDHSSRLIVGCMTGTSIDGLDCAVVRASGRGLELRASFVRGSTTELGVLATPLRNLAGQSPMTAGEIASLSHEFSLLHAGAVRELVGHDSLDLVCVHGQTIFHKPPLGWQLLNPWPIARALNTPVVFDLRGADLAAGGQGAPITPIADALLLRHHPELAGGFAVVNLGGFANATRVPGEACGANAGDWTRTVRGFDICACNQLLDRIARDVLGVAFDDGGRIAGSGSPDPSAASILLGAFKGQGDVPRSLGTGNESFQWIDETRKSLSGADLAATACEAIGVAIVERCRGAHAILLAGGGARNAALVSAIRRHAGCTSAVLPTDHFGIPIAFREAIEFAVLGALCQDGVPITLPAVTGVPSPGPLSGAWVYPSAPISRVGG